jgi:hypothetical protein
MEESDMRWIRGAAFAAASVRATSDATADAGMPVRHSGAFRRT